MKYRLELLCGANDVDKTHLGYFSESNNYDDYPGPVHPKHVAIKEILDSKKIRMNINPSYQEQVFYSDAYIYMDTLEELKLVAQVIEEEGFEGHYLDTNEPVSNELERLIKENNWELG